MQIKVIQVNIFRGRYLEALIEFLKIQKPDIVFMQEVTSGFVNLYEDRSINLFEYVKRNCGFDGVFYPVVVISDKPDSYEGNAVLTRFPILESRQIKLKEFSQITFADFNDLKLSPQFARSIVEVTLFIDGKEINAMSCHGAWTRDPVDTKEKVRQAKLISEYLKILKTPFIMGADMNMTPESKVIGMISKVCVNWTVKAKVRRTTHPLVHKTVPMIPGGLVVDYIFTSRKIKLLSLETPEVLVSDHLPLVATLELAD